MQNVKKLTKSERREKRKSKRKFPVHGRSLGRLYTKEKRGEGKA